MTDFEADTELDLPGRAGIAEDLDAALQSPEIADAKAAAKHKLFGLAPPTPQRIDRFVVVERLGGGGMGVVYAAYDPQLDRKVALKLLRHAGGDDADALTMRLFKEAQAMARVNHPNVITVHEVGTFEGKVFVAMEFIDGLTLRAWVDAQERSWPALREVFVAIGRGLAAAHASQLVHRDFKPDNVMIANDGRVSVLDFGLAKVVDETGAVDSRPTKVATIGEITQTGAILGTPAYMAPEQHKGEPVDARADQFSFCVALFEAVYGRRPFRGQTYAALVDAVCDGTIEEPPERGELPARAYRAVLRGLSAAPEDRFDSMDDLLHELGADASSRRRTVLALGGAGLLAVASAIGARAFDPDPACTAADAALSKATGSDRLKQAEAAFTATDLAYATDAWQSVRAGIDDYALRWHGRHAELCDEGIELPAEERVGRLACLHGRARELDTLTELMATADAEVVERAVEAMGALTSPDDCATEHGWRNSVRLPEEPHQRSAVVEARAELAHARTLAETGKLEAGEAAAASVLGSETAASYPPLRAEAGLVLGRLQRRRGDLAVSQATLTEATYGAIEADHDEVAIETTTELVWLIGTDRGAFDDAVPWLRLAEALQPRGGDRRAATSLGLAAASMFMTAGRHDEATQRAVGAVAGLDEDVDPPALIVQSLLWLARLAILDGKIDEGRTTLTRAREVAERSLPEADPTRALVFERLGGLEFTVGDVTAAREHWQATVNIEESLRGAEHPAVGAAFATLAWAEFGLGRVEAAKTLLDRADALGGTRTEDRTAVEALRLRANMALERGDTAAAGNLTDRALAVARRHGPEHPLVADVLLDSARVAIRRGDTAAAQARLDQVRRIAASRWPAASPHRHTLTWLSGELLLAQGEPRRAADALGRAERALAQCCEPSLTTAWVREALARALQASGGDAERIEGLRRKAAEGLQRHGRSLQ